MTKKIKNNYFLGVLFFFLLILFIRLSPNALIIELKSDLGRDTYQIFFNVGKGFNEKDSVKSVYRADTDFPFVKIHDIPIRNIRSFRIDPGTKTGQLQIKSISVRYRLFKYDFKSAFYTWTNANLLKAFSPAHDISDFHLSDKGDLVVDIKGTDPYFTFSGEWDDVQKIINKKFFPYKIFIGFFFLVFIFVLFLVYQNRKILNEFLFERCKLGLVLEHVERLFEQIRLIDLKWPKFKDLCIFLLIGVMAMIVLGANPFRGETVAPTDLLMFNSSAVGFESVRNKIPKEKHGILNPARSDIIDSKIPGWKNYKRSIKSGEPLIWYPQSSGGSLGAQHIGGEFFTPSFWMFVAFEDDALGFYMAMLINLFIAGVGTYLMARTILSVPPAFFSAIIFMFSGPIAGWFFWSHVSTVIWLPWLLFVTIKYFKKNDPIWLFLITVVSALMILGGFPAVAAYAFYAFALLVFLWSILSFQTIGKKLKSSLFPLVSVFFSFVLCAPLLFSFIEQNNQIVILGKRGGGTFFKTWTELIYFINTDISSRALYPEGVCYVGILAVLFSIVGTFSIMQKKAPLEAKILTLFNIIFAVLSISIAFGLIPRGLIVKIPVFKSNPWNRILLVSSLSIAFLAGIGLEYCLKRCLFLMDKVIKQIRAASFSKHHKRFSILVIVFLVSLVLFYQFLDQRSRFRILNAVTPSEWFFPQTETLHYVSTHLNDLQYVFADASYFIAGTITAYGVSDWFAHSFHADNEKALLSNLVSKAFRSKTAAIFHSDQIRFENPEFTMFADILGIKYILVNSKTEVEERLKKGIENWNILQLEKDIKIVERKEPTKGAYYVSNLLNLPAENEWREMTSGIKVNIKKSTELIVDYDMPHSGWIVLPMRLYPGWLAYIGEKKVPLEKYQGVLPAIRVSGPCEIRYVYKPKSLKFGIFVSATGGFLWLIILSGVYISKGYLRRTPNG